MFVCRNTGYTRTWTFGQNQCQDWKNPVAPDNTIPNQHNCITNKYLTSIEYLEYLRVISRPGGNTQVRNKEKLKKV